MPSCNGRNGNVVFRVGNPVRLAEPKSHRLRVYVKEIKKEFGDKPCYVLAVRRNNHQDKKVTRCRHPQLLQVAAVDGRVLRLAGGGDWWCGSWFAKVDRRNVPTMVKKKKKVKPIYVGDR